MRRYYSMLPLALCVLITTACGQEYQESFSIGDQTPSREISVDKMDSTIVESSLAESSYSENTNTFSIRSVSFPNTFPSDTELDGFLASKTKANLNGTVPIHVDDENVYFWTRIDDHLRYFRFDRNSHEIISISNTLPLPDFDTGTKAFVGKTLYTTYVKDDQLFHVALDFDQESIETLAITPPETTDRISRIFTYPLNTEEYVESWFEMASPRIFHIELFGKDSTKKEIFTKQEATGEEYFYYVVNDNKIYEYMELSSTGRVSVNIYGLDGTLLSSVFLPELSDLLKQRTEDDNYLNAVDVFGDFFAVNIFSFPHNNCYIYNLKDKYLIKIEDAIRIRPAISSNKEMEHFVFQLEHATKDYETVFDLYCLDRNGSVSTIANDIVRDSVATDGKTVVYIKNGIVYERLLR